MPCYHPRTGYRTANGQVVWNELRRHGETSEVTVACGQCSGCLLERSRQQAIRCVHETKLYENNCFITLTYDDKHLPYRSQLTHKHFADFMKRLRRRNEPNFIKNFMCGEYGEITHRPHYHSILFNHDWDDKRFLKTTSSGENIYTSAQLASLWPYGHSSTGEATFESAAYIARYCLKKVRGEAAEAHYYRHDADGPYQQEPEYNQFSNGLGEQFMRFFQNDIYTNDYVIIRGMPTRVPKFYDRKFKRIDEAKLRDIKEQREWNGYTVREDNTPERLRVKEIVANAKTSQLIRGKI